METFYFEISFTCTNTGTLKTLDKGYKAQSKVEAYKGITAYCNSNKTMVNCAINLTNETKG